MPDSYTSIPTRNFSASRCEEHLPAVSTVLSENFKLAHPSDDVFKAFTLEYLDRSGNCQINGQHIDFNQQIPRHGAELERGKAAHELLTQRLVEASRLPADTAPEIVQKFCAVVASQLTCDGALGRASNALGMASKSARVAAMTSETYPALEAARAAFTVARAKHEAGQISTAELNQQNNALMVANQAHQEASDAAEAINEELRSIPRVKGNVDFLSLNIVPTATGFSFHQRSTVHKLGLETGQFQAFEGDVAAITSFRFKIELECTDSLFKRVKDKFQSNSDFNYKVKGYPIALDVQTASEKFRNALFVQSKDIWENICDAFAIVFSMNRFEVRAPSKADLKELERTQPQVPKPPNPPTQSDLNATVYVRPDLFDSARKVRISYTKDTVKGELPVTALRNNRLRAGQVELNGWLKCGNVKIKQQFNVDIDRAWSNEEPAFPYKLNGNSLNQGVPQNARPVPPLTVRQQTGIDAITNGKTLDEVITQFGYTDQQDIEVMQHEVAKKAFKVQIDGLSNRDTATQESLLILCSQVPRNILSDCFQEQFGETFNNGSNTVFSTNIITDIHGKPCKAVVSATKTWEADGKAIDMELIPAGTVIRAGMTIDINEHGLRISEYHADREQPASVVDGDKSDVRTEQLIAERRAVADNMPVTVSVLREGNPTAATESADETRKGFREYA